MKTRNLVSYIVGGFALGTMILLAIQYVTTDHVRELISGNEKLLREFNLTNELIDLQKDHASRSDFTFQSPADFR